MAYVEPRTSNRFAGSLQPRRTRIRLTSRSGKSLRNIVWVPSFNGSLGRVRFASWAERFVSRNATLPIEQPIGSTRDFHNPNASPTDRTVPRIDIGLVSHAQLRHTHNETARF